jgi:FdhD protein
MARGRTQQFLVTRIEDGVARRVPDELVVEEPLEIRLDGHRVSTTMRTPGNDFELAAGFLHTEGALGGAPITTIRYCGTGSAVETEFNVVTVETGGVAPVPLARTGTTSSSCGLCGSDAIEALCDRLVPMAAAAGEGGGGGGGAGGGGTQLIDIAVLERIADVVRPAQALFESTGAVHGAAAFDAAGVLLCVREDIGRHNAVDKVVGRLLLDGQLPATGLGLFVSGRASFEMVQKAWAGGFSTLVAVSAPSALAVETARRAGLVLVGFARPGRLNVYAP